MKENGSIRFLELRYPQDGHASSHSGREDLRIIQDYVRLRKAVFESFGMFYYDDEPDKFDKHQDTIFVIPIEKGKVLGGRRLMVHEPFSGTKLKTLDTIPEPNIQGMLPHLDTHSMKYGELGGLCLDKSVQGIVYGGKKISHLMYEVTFNLVKREGFHFIVSEVVPNNMQRFIDAASTNGAMQIVPRPEVRSNDGDEDFRIFVSFKPESELSLLSEEMKKTGIGKPLARHQIEELVENRARIAEEKKSQKL